jgi:hypothetical protein
MHAAADGATVSISPTMRRTNPGKTGSPAFACAAMLRGLCGRAVHPVACAVMLRGLLVREVRALACAAMLRGLCIPSG